jgi:hypothetical protein
VVAVEAFERAFDFTTLNWVIVMTLSNSNSILRRIVASWLHTRMIN